MKNLVSTGIVFLFWSFLAIGAIKFAIKIVVPRRIRRSFSRLGNFILNLICTTTENYSKKTYDSLCSKLKERRESEKKFKEELTSESLDAETIKYEKAVAGSGKAVSDNVIHHNFKKKRAKSK